MAGNDSQKQLFTLIRDFAAEKSQGERRITELKKRIVELRSNTNAANLELEDSKRSKETVEQELKGYEVELAMNEASIQALEVRIDYIQCEVSAEGLHLESLKNEEGDSRDNFIREMFELNASIRNFHKSVASAMNKGANDGSDSTNGVHEETYTDDAEFGTKELKDSLEQIISQTKLEEQDYQTLLHARKLVQQELSDLEAKASLMQRIMSENTELMELTKQTTEWEVKCASFGDELQKRFACPRCNADNTEAAGGLLQTSDGN